MTASCTCPFSASKENEISDVRVEPQKEKSDGLENYEDNSKMSPENSNKCAPTVFNKNSH